MTRTTLALLALIALLLVGGCSSRMPLDVSEGHAIGGTLVDTPPEPPGFGEE